ncbi:MAG: RHS repeat domain-containing protein, partial [Pyrinomonadaceae bacterium]
MITLSTPAATESIRAMVGQTAQEIRFSFLSSSIVINYPKWLNAFFAAQSRGDDLTLNQVRIFPGDLTIRQGSEAVLTAVGFDSSGEPISGLAFNWSFTDTSRRTPTRHFSGGIFKGTRAGTFLVKAENSGFYDEVRITVRPITAEEMSFLAEDKKEGVRVSSRSGIEGKEGEKQALKNAPQINSLIGQGTWNDGNWLSADDPGNLPGNPPGGPMDDGAGNGNFQISAPVISLSGRGIDLALNLNYNSRVWNKSGNELTYDIDVGQPAPGWSLGFGKIVHMGQGGCMLIDADGTRHGYTGSINSWSNGMSFTGHTADGSFIDYGCWFNYGQYGGGWAKLPNGTEVVYSTIGPGNSHVYPTMITDVQGNYITITYRNPSNPQIEIIKDTMGRVVTFHYDQLNRLIEVRAPRMQDQDPIFGSGKTRTVMRLHYRPLTLNYSYAGGITPVVRQSTVQVIDAIYYPGTQTGYWFGDTDSYSTYGMITRVVEHRGMSWQAGSEEQGEVVPGTMTKQASYNYPLTTTNESGRTSGIGLSDAPTYTKLTESWAGRDVEEDAVTEYAINNNDWKFDGTSNSPARSITIIQPTGVISRQYSYRTPGTWTDGLVFTDETVVMNNQVEVIVARSLVSWQQGNGINYLNYDSPRPGWAKVFDENGHYVKTVYTYGTGRFNQITRSCDYDNSDTLLRCSSAEYENSAAYIGQFNGSGQFTGGRHIFNLVKSSRVENPDGSIASRTDYEYDNYTGNALRDTPGVIQHLHTHNPYTAETQQGNVCMLWSPQNGMCNYEGQEIWIAGDLYYCSCQEWNEVSVYDPATEKRGNVTKITTYSDANTSSGPIVETRSYDMTGNPVRISSACCEETSIEFSSAFQYAYPTSQTRGSANPQSPYRITTSSFYSFETGLVISSTDANGLISQTWYDPNTLRAVKTVSPTGAYTNFSYDDTAMTIEEEVREPDGWVQGPLAGKSKKYLNGIGQVRKEESFAPGGIVDIVEIKYTKYGEEWKQSRPYRAGDTVYWSEKFYDSQRRLVKVVEPDGSETRSFYNETQLPDSVSQKPGSRIRVVDAWGRERWGRYDQQGRLVEVVEPNPDRNVNPTGSVFTAGSLLTKYFYDTLGRLVQTEQGAQTRKFKYDSLGRLTRQKLAEQTATLNESGAFVGIGHQDAIWAEAFVYDNRSNLIQKTDPRGVRTNFSYQLSGGGVDPLNRLQSRSYDLSGPMQPNLTIHSAPAVTFEYMTTGDRTRIKKVRTQGFLTEEYSYDALSRVSEYKQTVDYRPNYPMTVNYLYDALDRVTEVYYPAQYGLTGSPRKTLANTYDKASRLSSLKIDGTEVAGNISYNASDQTTSIKIGPAGANQVT